DDKFITTDYLQQCLQNKHEAKADMRSPRFTTRLSDLPVIC
ncbi:TPA: DUF4113 domain-containing protein, partial [Klebsiella pneumoniae]|nr:DUF4113 domain-containing protein [Klebsiella pneumoniae]HCI8956677.1 DUF4113 domain-containing protein [Klebsiella pneumoniae]HCI9392308.1 DUF4113 domain-containing protein [Klebsiella pneumoniae]HCI9429965.1 DUF4113 domain-containing protein [Klebsiella pneumoniae]HCI9457082.1 DUF4113 domain-containing protein [Klebsiella pneumoniae]